MHPRAIELLEAALTRPPPERAAFVRAEAGSDEHLAGDALRLLEAHRASEGRFEHPLRRIGDWQLAECVGAGGMGEVYAATRTRGGFEQRAALKLMTIGGAAAKARFAAEREFLATLEHPGIARIIDGGDAPDGRPFVVMEWVQGEPIDRYCRDRALDIPARLALFESVLDAVGAAHRALILHRDIKPANVYVADNGQVKLLDFGIAKSLAADRGLTATGPGPLTPQWASPEQLAGKSLTVASDIYSLGLLLHQLLTGRLPFDFGDDGFSEMAAKLAAGVPSRPASRLDGSALGLAERSLDLWRSRLAGDLERVVVKALAADPERRYASVEAFADDLRAWREHRPVAARVGERGYRLRLFVRRHRLAVASAAAALLALLGGLGVAAIQAQRASDAAARAESANRFLMAMIADANPAQSGREPTLRQAIDRAAEKIAATFVGQPDIESDVRLGIGLAYTSLMELDAAQAQLDRALALRAKNGAARAAVLQALALLDWTRGRTNIAEQRYREAHAEFSAARDWTRVGEVANDLAALMSDLGRFDEAIAFAQDAVASARTLELDAATLGARLENLGSALQGAGRLQEAEDVYAECIPLLERALPARTVALAVAHNNFALVLRAQGKWEQALASFERAIAVRERAFGADHGDLAGPLINAARLQIQLGRSDIAQANADRALALADKAFAPDYIGRGHVYLGAAQVRAAAGDRDRARVLAQQALAVFERADAADPAWIADAKALIEPEVAP